MAEKIRQVMLRAVTGLERDVRRRHRRVGGLQCASNIIQFLGAWFARDQGGG